MIRDDEPATDRALRDALVHTLGIDADRVAAFTNDTPLFGALPELDSMAVAGLLTDVEDRMGIVIEDDEVDGELLETFGSLKQFVLTKAAV
ncbi:acyl carrier protein [Sphingomonas jejuensis]|jgi:acyl carrier protein|uniref:Acyl carrier protein n=1 Tax=Sphingomonas jejuensis TaxID=904715 RepID=A0ABX0XKC3_9SPHN|nr:acyl carrier protein [Sphingomonas jejuensis]NJC33307.1 acyl carrier protein [Sphingomonas jejuensis]